MPGEYHWKIKEVNDSDYQVILTYNISGTLMKRLFNKAKDKLTRKLKKDIDGDMGWIERFEVPVNYKNTFFPVIANAVKKCFKKVCEEGRQDGFIMLNYNVENVIYSKKKDENWEAEITLTGQFTKK